MKNVVAENLDLNIDSDLFSPLSTEEKKADDVIRPSVGYWANAWRRLKQNKVALFSLVMIIVIIIFFNSCIRIINSSKILNRCKFFIFIYS